MAVTRTFAVAPALVLLALAACQVSPDVAADGGQPIACALQGASDFASECLLVEMGEGPAASILMRHPDGGFRKLARAQTPAGYTEFDGAERAKSWREEGEVVLAIGEDRYRWKDPVDD